MHRDQSGVVASIAANLARAENRIVRGAHRAGEIAGIAFRRTADHPRTIKQHPLVGIRIAAFAAHVGAAFAGRAAWITARTILAGLGRTVAFVAMGRTRQKPAIAVLQTPCLAVTGTHRALFPPMSGARLTSDFYHGHSDVSADYGAGWCALVKPGITTGGGC